MKLNGIGVALLMLVAPPAFAAPPDAKPSPATPVSVTNTSANPVPVTGSVTIQNPPTSPVPVTGSVTIQGDVAGGVESVDQNAVVFADFIRVNSGSFGNARTPLLDVKPYKEIRISISSGSGTSTGPIEVAVTLGSGNVFVNADRFTVTRPAGPGVDYEKAPGQ